MRKTLFLIGMMGAGKSTIGRRLAEMTDSPLMDLDEEIERFEGRSIPQLFDEVGDSGFRLCETAALKRACSAAPCIVSTGGGIVTRQENIALMRAHGLVVWLNRPLEDMIADVGQDMRPNLAGNKAERMRTLFAQREALYRKAAHIEFDNRLPPTQSASLLAAELAQKNVF